jgi:hypothetical protein
MVLFCLEIWKKGSRGERKLYRVLVVSGMWFDEERGRAGLGRRVRYEDF